MENVIGQFIVFFTCIPFIVATSFRAAMASDDDIEYFAEKRALRIHHIDSMILLIFTSLMVVIVLTAWFFKHHRLRFLNEPGLTLLYGLLIGYLILWTNTGQIESNTMQVIPINQSTIYHPPDFLRLGVSKADNSVVHFHYEISENMFADSKKEPELKKIERKTVFSPEIFFNIILPPVMFNAGYSLKKRRFFRNIGSILSFVFIGTTVTAFLIGILMFIVSSAFSFGFKFQELLFFGCILSPTDPLSVLAVFNELHVEADLYALVFGESALNDAVAIVMAGIIDTYSGSSDKFDFPAIGFCIWSFIYVFFCSLLLGSLIGCINALITKFTQIAEFPNLEASMFILLSYVSFLLAEVVGLTGIVAVVFCGICQAHYTFNNLSTESQFRTKQFFEIISFLAESFIFLYIGVAVVTSNAMKWNVLFIIFAIVAMVLSRIAFVYPLCSLLNIKRKPPIPLNHQHMLVFSGLRGAVSFALASRNTSTENRQIMLASTSIIVISTVLINGGLTNWMVDYLGIKYGESLTRLTEDDENTNNSTVTTPTTHTHNPWDKSFLPRKWYNFDANFMKPLLTNANPTLLETMPSICRPLARLLTTESQLRNFRSNYDDTSGADESLTQEIAVDPDNGKVKFSKSATTMI